jgi:hypothetical protein
MKHIKTRLTNLKTRILEIIPEGNDLLGFPGISRALIIESIEDTYQLLDLLNQYSHKFEAVLLQRRLAQSIDRATEYLKEKFKNQNADDFNRFLNKIAEMHYASKEAYILFTKEPIRLDIALQKAKGNLAELENQNAELQPLISKLKTSYDETANIISSLTTNNSESSLKLKEISDSLTAAVALKKKADAAFNSVGKVEAHLQSVKTEIDSYQTKISDLTGKLEKTHQQSVQNKEEFEKSLNDLQESINKNNEHQIHIQETIENANRFGMAASFKKRKDELTKPYWAWGTATVITIAILIVTSYSVFTILKDQPFKYEYLLVRVPIFAAFVWLGWFCAKQFGFVSRIREDYSYKYAVSMAFEGYKNATKEINAEMLENLLTLTLQNISSSPLNIYETGNNHGTPVNEILSTWGRKKGKMKIRKDSKNNTEEVVIDNTDASDN